jgi:hypothetical protein
VVYRRKELGNVAFQAVYTFILLLCLSEEFNDAVHGVMASFKFPAGVGIVDEEMVPDRLDNVHYGMMDNTISEWRDVNGAPFRLVEGEFPVIAGLIGLVDQVFLDGDQILLQIIAERQDLVGISPPQGRLVISLADILEGNYFMIEVSVSFHCLSTLMRVAFGLPTDHPHSLIFLPTQLRVRQGS